MKHTLIIPMEPFSLNKVHCRDQRYLTSSFKEWACNILLYISEDKNQKKIKELKEEFNPKNHYFKIQITSHYPREQFWTKQDQISSKTHDVSNIEKPLIDVVFTPKYHGTGSPYKGPNFNIDDKYIKEMNSRQRAADSHLIEMIIELRPLSELDLID